MIIDKDLKLKWEKFKRDKRAFISFLMLCSLFIVTTPAELLCNVRPIILIVDGKTYFPILFTYSEIDFGGTLPSEPDYLSKNFKNLLAGNSPNSPLVSSSKNKQQSFELGLDDFNEDEPSFSIEFNDFEDDGHADIISPPKTKNSIKKNIEKLFKVSVIKVNIINTKTKIKIKQGKLSKKSGYKKAIITLKKGQSIDLTTGI